MKISVLLIGFVFALSIVETSKSFVMAIAITYIPQNQIEGLLVSVGSSIPLSTRQLLDRLTPQNRRSKGSFILASILGNTGFIGLALIPSLVDSNYSFASIILAEEYDLDRQVAASTILLSTVALPIIISIWLAVF